MTLEEWRRQEGFSYQVLAERFRLSSATQARRYALGKVEVPPDKKEEMIAASGGLISLADFHQQRLAATRRHGPTLAPDDTPHHETDAECVA